MSPALLLTLWLHQTPPQGGAVVLATHRERASAPVVEAVARELRRALSYAGVESPIAPGDLGPRLAGAGVKLAACADKDDCAVAAGIRLKVANVISLSVVRSDDELTIEVVAMKTSDGETLALDGFTVSDGELGAVMTGFAPFAERVHDALWPRRAPRYLPPPIALDVPKQAPKPPAIVPVPVVVDELPQPVVVKRGPGPYEEGAYVAVGGAAAASLVTVILVSSGTSAAARVDQRVRTSTGQAGSPLSYSEARAISSSANAQLTGALVTSLTSVAFATAAGILWSKSLREP